MWVPKNHSMNSCITYMDKIYKIKKDNSTVDLYGNKTDLSLKALTEEGNNLANKKNFYFLRVKKWK